MILESTQLLWTAWWCLEDTICSETLRPYRPTHRNHPCAVWVRATTGNYAWLCALAEALVDEYHYRYGPRIHACEPHIQWLKTHIPPHLPTGPRTKPAQAMPDEYRDPVSTVRAYRSYYIHAKTHMLDYCTAHATRLHPHWLKKSLD